MSKKSSFSNLINGEQPVLIDFYAEWCGPCKAMMPVVEDVAGQVKGSAKVIKIDIDKNQELTNKLGIRGVPTFILYQNGEQKWRASGMQSATTLLNVINQAQTA